MQKIVRISASTLLLLGLIAPVNWAMAETESIFSVQGSNLIAAKKKKKKSKHNYRSLTESSVTGDEYNSDTSGYYSNVLSTQIIYFRRISIPGLSISNPFPLRVQRYATPVTGFEEEHYGGGSYFITEGNVWANYGYKLSSGSGTTNFTGATNHRIFKYNGGTRKKATKRQALKAYDFSISGDSSNADVVATISNSGYSTNNQYFRKIAIPGLRTNNLGDYRIYMKNAYYQMGISEDYWVPISSNYFIMDDYLYVAYAYEFFGNYAILYSPYNPIGDYRFYLYSDGKVKKKKLTKQYVKRYTLNVPGGQGTEDKIVTVDNGSAVSYYYYKKVAIPGLKMNDQFNISVMKKVIFSSGFTGEAWAPGSFYITDGYLWINFGLRTVNNLVHTDTYTDTGNGDYQVFLYK